jgi:ABC-type transporter MlaC component
MKKIQKCIIFILFAFVCTVHVFAEADDAAKKTVFSLIDNLKTETQKPNPEIMGVISASFDWNDITNTVLKSARRMLRGNDDNKKSFINFLPEFKEKFKRSIVARYSKTDNIEKFRNARFDKENATTQEICKNYLYVKTNVTFTDPETNKEQMVDVKWKVKVKGYGIVDIEFEGFSPFRTQESEITAAFNKNGPTNFQQGLNDVSAMYDQ